MRYLETAFKQRAYDGKWMRLAKVRDEENAYVYQSDNGDPISIIPTKWIIVGVYDLLGEWEL